MGKVLITSNRNWCYQLDGIFQKSGFKATYSDDNLIFYGKKYVDNQNYYASGDCGVGCTGTWAYKNEVGKAGLKLLYTDAIEEGMEIKDIRANLLGTYCCVIRIGDKLRAFVDETHTYAIYYTMTELGFLMTNTYYHIQKCIHGELSAENVKLTIATRGLSSNRTIFENVFRLLEDEMIEANLSTGELRTVTVLLNEYSYDLSSKSSVLDVLDSTINRVAKALNKNSRSKLIFATGGADSRLKLALDCHNGYSGDKLRLAYWGGRNVITNGTESDRRVNEMLADKVGCKTEFIQLTEDFKDAIESIDLDEADKYGEYLTIYAHDRSWLNIFSYIHETSPGVDEIVLGYDPDVIREVGTVEVGYRKPYTVENLINSSFLRSGLMRRVFDAKTNLNDLVREDIKKSIDNLDQRNMSLEDAVDVFNYARLDMGSILINYINQFYYCCNLIYTKPVWDIAWKVPYKYKMNSQLSIGLVQRWNAELLDIPMFSQHHFMVIRNGELRKTKKHAFLSWLKPKVINTRLYSLLWTNMLERKITKDANVENSDLLFEQCMDYLKNNQTLREVKISLREDAERKGFDLAALGWVVSFLKFIDMCNLDKNGNVVDLNERA